MPKIISPTRFGDPEFEIIDIAIETNELALHRGSGKMSMHSINAKPICFVAAEQKQIGVS